MEIKFKKICPHAVVPTLAHEDDAGYDLYSTRSVVLCAGRRTVVETGICVELPQGFVGLVCPRSGLALEQGITVLNAPGILDAGYRGEIKVLLYNSNVTRHGEYFQIKEGMKIAQLVIVPLASLGKMVEAPLSESERGTGGFGSTGDK